MLTEAQQLQKTSSAEKNARKEECGKGRFTTHSWDIVVSEGGRQGVDVRSSVRKDKITSDLDHAFDMCKCIKG